VDPSFDAVLDIFLATLLFAATTPQSLADQIFV